ncbi:hypothetical protein NRB_48460 [Novosphingobium sp. 11B]|uniref:Uncharacterized protein n=1 Tax=Novosphingobium resinovorum TaxID=158500 RepID=A0A1D8A662_9SPHN|nr:MULTISPECIES: hypothetical protein [Sphingomonadaceae]AOR77585.1 hypothetical protein BES08_13090 [Novosphingobium resinovorum]EJU10129.1 hypothetical protein LH128_25443 [Sphingomonas sp. LH128]
MFGTKITHVFRSRWHALMWSAGVLATAYCSIPTPDNGDTGTDSAAQQQAQAEQAQQAMAAWSNATGGK